jgi:hypothetical protein
LDLPCHRAFIRHGSVPWIYEVALIHRNEPFDEGRDLFTALDSLGAEYRSGARAELVLTIYEMSHVEPGDRLPLEVAERGGPQASRSDKHCPPPGLHEADRQSWPLCAPFCA